MTKPSSVISESGGGVTPSPKKVEKKDYSIIVYVIALVALSVLCYIMIRNGY